MILNLLLNLAIFIVPSLVVWNQIIFYIYGKNDNVVNLILHDNGINLPKLSIIVPTKGERIDVIQGLINNIYEARWDKNKLEIIIVSDDDQAYFDKLLSTLIIPPGLDVKIFRREKRLGYKSGALAFGLQKSTGDLILTLDVDARIEKDSLIRAYNHMVNLGCDAVTMEWHGYSNISTSLARALMVSTVLTSRSILRGRDKLGLKVLPIGCGTIFKRSALEAVNGWDYTMVQDDYELGTRLINRGFRICASSSPVYVEVPDNLIAFYVQQTRWAMGTMEVLSRRFKYIVSSNIKIWQKIEIIAYLSQYIPIILTFISATVFGIAGFLGIKLSMSLPMFVIWAITLSVYAIIFVNSAKRSGIDTITAIKALGRLSAYTVGISPFLLVGTLNAFKKTRTYIVTPKGKKAESNIGYPILAFGVFFLLSAFLYMFRGDFLTFIWLAYYSIAFLYTFIAYIKGL
ncbi:putative glycosyl transferase [Saccharolobus shibatae]|uniref:Putative glycosyl transferase n=1 Tax=Saccharolobus shibatae TaxID=2286 RepID=A0A8F5BSL4_9CREN|nr:putative glycosyl transferase [Saccharolobus shibatae]